MSPLWMQGITAIWIVIVMIWTFRSLGNKRTEKIPFSLDQAIISILLFVGFILLFSGRDGIWIVRAPLFPASNTLGALGLTIAIISAGIAIWARMTIGKNWSGAIITLKEDHKLVAHGPYQYIRHPIYTGFIGMAIGTALVAGSWSAVIGCVLIAIGFAMRIPREEKLMHEQFPEEYPAYKARTGSLLPPL